MALTTVKIWFTEKLEPARCKLQVFEESGREIDKGNQAVDSGNRTLLTVSLPPLKPGKYKVAWRAVSAIPMSRTAASVRGAMIYWFALARSVHIGGSLVCSA